MTESFPQFILASNSPARARVLSQINLEYLIIPSNIDEMVSVKTPESYVTEISIKKAKALQKFSLATAKIPIISPIPQNIDAIRRYIIITAIIVIIEIG